MATATSSRTRPVGIALAWVAGIILAAIIALRLFVYEPFRIPSDSMYPTLPNGSFLIVDKRGFGNFGPLRQFKRAPTATIERGDLVTFLVSDDGPVYVKRVIGLPGDRVRLEGRQLTINNVPIPVQVGAAVHVDRFRYQLASETIDGRQVSIAWLPERPSLNFESVVPEGHYFMLGDNRDNARDSRFADIGFIPKERLIGRVVKVFAPR